jgi:S-adenosylmethionine:tRNA-ribosyltransferase-isomerase (queuine synthetase)
MVTVHVGAGTFLPVKVEDTLDHRMRAEVGTIDAVAADAINRARAAGGRIVAVGTTSLRLLEAAADASGQVGPFSDKTDLFHHARLSLQDGRSVAHEFPSAALDLVHAGLRLCRPRAHEAGLRARQGVRLQIPFLWRLLPARSRGVA